NSPEVTPRLKGIIATGRWMMKQVTATIAMQFTVTLTALLPAWGQTPPGYSELFENPARTDQLTQADLPNLGRLVALEATSMFVHVRSELADSPESFRLLDEISTVWRAADAFSAAVSDGPSVPRRIEAGRLAFVDLDAAYYRLQA